MRLPSFEYLRPTSLEEALAALADSAAGSAVLAGGTDLLLNMKQGLRVPRRLVGIAELPELQGVAQLEDGSIRIGSGETLAGLVRHPLLRARLPALVDALRSVGSLHVRNRATLGGNLCLPTRCWYTNQSESWRASATPCWKTQGTLCHVVPSALNCRALNGSDGAPALIALNARLMLCRTEGQREVPAADFYRDDGIDHLAASADELMVAVVVPGAPVRAVFLKAAQRAGLDYGLASVAAAVTGGNRRPASVMLVAGSVASRPVLLEQSAAIILEQGLGERAIAAAAEAARADLGEITNLYTPAGYKKRVVHALVRRALEAIRRQRLPQQVRAGSR